MNTKKIIFGCTLLFTVAAIAFVLALNLLPGKAKSFSLERLVLEKKPKQFEPEFLSWSLATSSAEWEARDSAVSFIFQNKMWTVGGLDGNGHVDENGVELYWEAPHFNDIWSTTDGVLWMLEAEHADFPPRRSMSIIEFKGKLWMFAGYSPEGGLQSDIWQSDDAVHWQKVAAKAAFLPREGQTVEIFKDRLWMIGGVNYDRRKALNDVWYSDDGVDWTLSTSSVPWRARWDHDTEVFNGKMYLASGMDLTLQTFNDVWVTDDGFNWSLVTEHAPWEGRQGGQLLNFKGLLWMVGRLNDEFDKYGPNDVWYSADGRTWQKTVVDPPWTGREDYSGLVYNGRMYVFGGMDANWQWRNDVWVSSN
ncbi:MAG: hypothetical protein Q7S05_04475 [bacterium]|nr:hypothetical protein [bacterium]